MIEAGLVDHWMKQYWPKINTCSATSLSKAGQALTLLDTQSAFFLIFIGVTAATFALLAEIFISSFTPTIHPRQAVRTLIEKISFDGFSKR